jgi:hypothetical protein
MEVLDQDVKNATIAANCISSGITSRIREMNFSNSAAVAKAVGGTPLPLNQTLQNPFFQLRETSLVLENGGVANQINPCEPLWCRTIPPIVDPEVVDWTWLIAVAASLAFVILGGLAFYFLYYSPRMNFEKQYRYQRGADVEFRRIRDVTGLEMEWCSSEMRDVKGGDASLQLSINRQEDAPS